MAVEQNENRKTKFPLGMYSKIRTISNGGFENDPRMREIERQMAQAGLGPSTKRGGRSRKRTFVPLFRNGDYRPVPKKAERRLESMTDRDQELVFRVHLRQLESTAVYKDDYYSTVVTKKEKEGEEDVFTEMAETVQTIRLSTRERGREGPGYGTKKSKRSINVDTSFGTSPTNSDHSKAVFANSLGTVQSWNPRAPRRVMGSTNSELLNPESDEKTTTSMLEDVRVRVRRSIEDGYDIIAKIHDICRGESTESLENQIRLLIATLHLRFEHGYVSLHERESWHSTRFFEYMCAAEKGRRFLDHVIDLLDLSELVRLMPALFANLGAMIFVVRVNRRKGNDGHLKLCRRMLRALRDAEVMPVDCLSMLQSFIMNHALEEKTLTCTLRSAIGSRLLYTCIQRIVKGVSDGDIKSKEVERTHIEQFAQVLIGVLPSAFKGAASAESVWDVVGSLDGLLSSGSRQHYRVDLSQLLSTGKIPSPRVLM